MYHMYVFVKIMKVFVQIIKVFVQIIKCIFTNYQMYLSTLFKYLSKLSNIFLLNSGGILSKQSLTLSVDFLCKSICPNYKNIYYQIYLSKQRWNSIKTILDSFCALFCPIACWLPITIDFQFSQLGGNQIHSNEKYQNCF